MTGFGLGASNFFILSLTPAAADVLGSVCCEAGAFGGPAGLATRFPGSYWKGIGIVNGLVDFTG